MHKQKKNSLSFSSFYHEYLYHAKKLKNYMSLKLLRSIQLTKVYRGIWLFRYEKSYYWCTKRHTIKDIQLGDGIEVGSGENRW